RKLDNVSRRKAGPPEGQPVADQRVRIINEVIGQEEIRRYTERTKFAKDSIVGLADALRQGSINQSYYDAALQRHSQKILEYQAAIKATTQAQNGFFGARNLNSFNLMSLGHIVDDLQYINGPMGIQPVLNNIMMLAPALGIVSVAAFQLH